MGKASKSRKHSAKMTKKREAKARRRAAYADLAGKSKKAKKINKRAKGTRTHKHAHAMANCGNQGCKRCHPRPKTHGARGLTKDHEPSPAISIAA